MSRYVINNYVGGLAAKLFNAFLFKRNSTFKQKKTEENIQFMGLKDKNGTLIYLGDILRDDNNNLLTPVCEVLNGEHILFFKPIKHLHKNFAIGCKSTYSNTLEVVGNMREHPELIKFLFTI